MGYTTEFEGHFHLDKPLREEHARYLHKFSRTRRVKRDSEKAARMDDPERLILNLAVGPQACYFVGGLSFAGQDRDDSILDYNKPPAGQPGLWCHWVPAEDGQGIEWDRGEKFYEYVDWLRYLVKHFLQQWGYVLNGDVAWSGEAHGDTGIIRVVNNVIEVIETNDDRDPDILDDD